MAGKHRDDDGRTKADSATTERGDAPKHRGGDHIRQAQRWGGGSKGSKGPITAADKRNQNSRAKS